MRTRSLLACGAALVLLSACASMKSDSGLGNATGEILKPEMQLQQISSVAGAARHVTGAIPVHFALRVANQSSDPITLKRVQVQSLGFGAYTIGEGAGNVAARPFEKVIAPNHFEVVDFWVPAVAQVTTLGANGPVTIRCIAQFDSPSGQFQHMVIQQVHDIVGSPNMPGD
jgi:hypothetical protein